METQLKIMRDELLRVLAEYVVARRESSRIFDLFVELAQSPGAPHANTRVALGDDCFVQVPFRRARASHSSGIYLARRPALTYAVGV